MIFIIKKYLFYKHFKGQVAVEYVLLLVISVAVALIMVEIVYIDSDETNSGFLIKYWRAIIKKILIDMKVNLYV